jgi:hypothetical protein
MNIIGKGKYEGDISEGWYHGKGTFKYENGVIYEGGFEKGQFHGDGVLIYPNGGRYKGKWLGGKMQEGSYEFSDGLEFSQPSKWDFCTFKDRRFYHEIINNIKNPEIEKFNERLFKNIPEGSYDTGDGFYDPEKGTIYTYENEFLRIPNEEEEEWIKLKCRYNPRKDEVNELNEDALEMGDEVIQNILREFSFKKYVINK